MNSDPSCFLYITSATNNIWLSYHSVYIVSFHTLFLVFKFISLSLSFNLISLSCSCSVSRSLSCSPSSSHPLSHSRSLPLVPPRSLSRSLAHNLSIPLSHSRSLPSSRSPYFPLSLPLSLRLSPCFLTPALSPAPSLPPSFSRSLPLCLSPPSLPHSLTPILSLRSLTPLPLPLPFTLPFSHPLSRSLSHPRSLSIYPALYRPPLLSHSRSPTPTLSLPLSPVVPPDPSRVLSHSHPLLSSPTPLLPLSHSRFLPAEQVLNIANLRRFPRSFFTQGLGLKRRKKCYIKNLFSHNKKQYTATRRTTHTDIHTHTHKSVKKDGLISLIKIIGDVRHSITVILLALNQSLVEKFSPEFGLHIVWLVIVT